MKSYESGAVARLDRRGLALCFFLAWMAALLVNRWVLMDFPNSADEYAYLWQALAFAGGHVTAPILHPEATFAFFHLGSIETYRFSRFPPGWPLLLTPGVWLDWPGVVNPLISALSLTGMLWLGARWVGPLAARLGVFLVGVSPFFLLNAGSYHSHPSCLLALVIQAIGLEHALERAGSRAREAGCRRGSVLELGPWLLVGGGLGLAVLVRPFTGLLLGAGLLLSGVWRLCSCRKQQATGGRETPLTVRWAEYLGAVIVGGLPSAIALGIFNQSITGCWWMFPTRLIDPEEGLGFGPHGHNLLQGLQNTLVWGIEGLATTFFLSPALLVLARGCVPTQARWLWGLLLLPEVGYVFYWNPGGNRYGPRFYFEGLLAFAPLVGLGMGRLLENLRAARRQVLLVPLAVLGIGLAGKLFTDAHRQISTRSAVFRAVQDAHLDRGSPRAIVLLEGDSADMPAYDLTRNPPDFGRAPVLFGRVGQDPLTDLRRLHPARQIYTYHWNPSGGTLVDTPEDPSRAP